MTRPMALAVLLLFAENLPLAARTVREAALPVPPIPPAEQPLPLAPVPNLPLFNPFDTPKRSMVTLDPDINHRAAPSQGMGYSRGASYQIDNDRRFLVLPGVQLHVPLP